MEDFWTGHESFRSGSPVSEIFATLLKHSFNGTVDMAPSSTRAGEERCRSASSEGKDSGRKGGKRGVHSFAR